MSGETERVTSDEQAEPEQNPNLALRAAARNGDEAEVASLLARGAEVNATSSDGWTPLMAAAKKGRASTVALLLGAGADPSRRNRFGSTALTYAVTGGYLEASRHLLAASADPNGRASEFIYSFTFLMTAVRNCDLPMMEALLDAGAAPDTLVTMSPFEGKGSEGGEHADFMEAQGVAGWTALMFAAGSKFAEAEQMVRLLLDRGADPNAGRGFGSYTALCEAAHMPFDAVFDLLIERGARPRQGEPVLYYAVLHGDARRVRRLLDLGADPNAKTAASGLTTLMAAAAMTHATAGRLLIDSGADLDARDAEGNTALALVGAWRKSRKRAEVAALLRRAGAR
jgi:ankyrin repeat protein